MTRGRRPKAGQSTSIDAARPAVADGLYVRSAHDLAQGTAAVVGRAHGFSRMISGRPLAPARALRSIPMCLLVLPAMLSMLWRTFLAQPIVPSGEQLNIATFVIAREQPAYLADDFTYGMSDPSRFYTPLQIDLFDTFWRSTGSLNGAIAVQTVLVVVATMVIAGVSMYFLTHNVVSGLVIAAAALNYRAVLSGGDIWGLGPSWSVLPRAWAAPLVFGVIALWLRAIEARNWRCHVLCGLLVGASVNVHPPTGAPLAAAIVGASGILALIDRGHWRNVITLTLGAAVGAIPFAVGYLSHIAVASRVDYEQFMTAARLRVDASLLPRVADTLTRSFTPGTDSFAVNVALAAGIAVAIVSLFIAGTERARLRKLALLSGVLVAVSVVAPLAAQALLMQLERSPIPTIDLFRGVRLLVPIGLIVAGLGLAAALGAAGWQRFLALPIGALTLVDNDTAESVVRFGVWPLVAALFVVVSLPIVPMIGRRLAFLPAVGLIGLVIVQPMVGMSLAPRVGALCCDVPPQPASERTTEELVRWVRTLPDNTVFETSSVEDNAALRLRIDTKHGVTWIAKDGNVLLYSDPAKAVLWGLRSLRARDIVDARDVAGLRTAAYDYGAALVLVDHLVWREPVAGANVIARWSGIANPTPTDWVGVFPVGQPDNEAYRLAAKYTSGTADGSVGLTFPGLTFDGTYEVRLFATDSWKRLAVSGPLVVSGSTATAGNSTAGPLAPSVAIEWSGITVPLFQNDRFTVFRP